ncbi:type VI secretion system baseplate subunit TssE [Methylovirgula sp. 4M-Z18]|nr:type VI secretion system baseplate subunit TssE [Methylovirgula sp. 4M-Z18]
MHAFREAFRMRDAAKPIDNRNEAGERVIAGRRTSPRSAVSETALRIELGEDLASLLNTVDLAAMEDLSGLEEVGASVLNFGMPDLAAIVANAETAQQIGHVLKQKLELYERRLVPGTVVVVGEPLDDTASGQLRFHINAEMYSTPTDIPVEFVADVEAESGKIRVFRL